MNKYSAIAPTEARPQDDLAAQAFLHTSQAGAWVPLQQAGITGFLVGFLSLLLMLKYRWTDWWFWPPVIWVIVTLVVWTLLQRHWFGLTSIQRLEALTGLDLDRDGKVAAKATVQVNISQDDGQNGYYRKTANFEVSPEKMAILAQGMLAGRPFTEKEWTGQRKPFSIDEFRAMRAEMLRRGIIEFVNPKDKRQGFKLTLVGKRVMQKLLYVTAPSPTPGVPDAQNE